MLTKMESIIDSDALSIIHRLEADGYEAYLVGGCVRDMLRGKEPHDWDITTSALPQQVLSCFAGETVNESGIKHGTVTVLRQGKTYEVTTYRIDKGYTDGRRPDDVLFVRNIQEDLARRDFTINAIAWHPQRGFRDPFGGRNDIENKLIRCVGEPTRRFSEDGLRVLRALRFASKLGYRIDNETQNAIYDKKDLLRQISMERIYTELSGILCGEYVEPVLLKYANILAVFMPEITPIFNFAQHNKYHHLNVWEHTVQAVSHIEAIRELRFVMLLHDIGKPQCFTIDNIGIGHFYNHANVSEQIARQVMRRLRASNYTVDKVCKLIKYHGIELHEGVLVRWASKLGGWSALRELLMVQRADVLSQTFEVRESRLYHLDMLSEKALQLEKEQNCLQVRDLVVNGEDVMAEGVLQGAQVGRILKALLEKVLDGTLENDREQLLQEIKSIK